MIQHRTQHGLNWILIIFGITILTLYMLTDCALIVSGTLTLRLWAIHLIYTPPPPMDESIKFKPLRKKDQSADTNTPPEIKKFLPYPSEKTQRSKNADAQQPLRNSFFKTPQKFSSIGGGGGILNGMALYGL